VQRLTKKFLPAFKYRAISDLSIVYELIAKQLLIILVQHPPIMVHILFLNI